MRARRYLAIPFAITLAALCLGLVLRATTPLQVPSNTWAAAGEMTTVRTGAASVLLPDGRIMITGGTDAAGNPVDTTEFFTADGTFTPGPSMNTPRSGHSAAWLYNGEVVVTGGTTNGGVTNSAEVFDPFTGAWSPLPPMLEARSGHTLTQLQDGSVLIAGGVDNSGAPVNALAILEIAPTEHFVAAGALQVGRKGHAAAALPNGRVLIVGGTDANDATLATTEIFDRTTGLTTVGPNLLTPRTGASATALLDGSVLIAGGSYAEGAAEGAPAELASAEIFDPATGAITATASMSVARTGQVAILLPNNNNVLIAGGTSAGTALASAELYTPWTGKFTATASMSAARAGATGAAMYDASISAGNDGLLLMAGGNGQTNAEVYGFATVKTDLTEYIPGQTVVITGSGWLPGETVLLTMQEFPNIDTPTPITVTADSNGHVYNTEFAPDLQDLGVLFYLTATGSHSQAQTTFRDAPKVGSVAVSVQSENPVHAGDSVTYTITVNRGIGQASKGAISANLSADNLPSGVSATFSPNPVALSSQQDSATAVLTIVTPITLSANANPGYVLSVKAARTDNATDNATGTGTLNVTTPRGIAPTITSSDQTTFTVGTVGTFNVTTSGTPTATISETGGLPNGVTFTDNGNGTATLDGTPTAAGTYALTLTAANGIPSNASQSFTLTVNKGAQAGVTLTAPSDATYGQTGLAVTAAGGTGTGPYSFGSGSSSACSVDPSTGSLTITSGTGTCAITATRAGDNNFLDSAASSPATVTINKADANVSVTGYTGVYDAAAHGATGSAKGVGDVPLSGLDLGATFTNAPGGTAHWSFTGGTNYKDQSGTVDIVINKADANVSVTGYTGVYDAAAHGATGSAKGVGDVPLSGLDLGATFTNAPGGTAHWTFTGGTNYNDQSGTVDIVISKANPTINITPYSVTYDGNAHTATGTATGIKGESLAGLTLTSTIHTAAGTYNSDIWTFTDATGNYNDASGTISDKIDPRPITITADAKTKILGAGDPALTYHVTSGLLVNGDTFSGSLIRATGEGVGSYAITQGNLALSSNYILSYVSANLQITYALVGGMCYGDMGHQILQPINFDGTSVFKQGSTTPAKFRVCDANGKSIGTAGVVSNFQLVKVVSGTTTVVDEEIYSTTPDAAFRWDSSAQQWIFNISTKNYSKNATYVFLITLNDGTTIPFQYGLK